MEHSNRFVVRITQGQDAIDSIKADWQTLLSNISTPTIEQDWRWNSILANLIFLSSFVLLCVYDEQNLIAIFPLQSKTFRRFGVSFKSLTNLSDTKLLDLSDALIHPDYHSKPVLSAIKQHFTTSQFTFIEFSEFTSRSSVAKLSTDGWHCEQGKYKNAYAKCGSPDDLKMLSKKHIKNVERLAAKTEESLGKISLEIFIGEEIKPSDIDELIEIEHSGWKAASGTSIKASNTRGFYESVIGSLAKTGDVYIVFLKAGNARIACALALKSKHRLFLHKIAYKDEVKEFGAGNIMLLNLLRAMAAAPSIDEVNLVTCPEWSERWHLQVDDRLSLRCINNNFKGRLFSLLLWVKRRLEKTATSQKTRLENTNA